MSIEFELIRAKNNLVKTKYFIGIAYLFRLTKYSIERIFHI